MTNSMTGADPQPGGRRALPLVYACSGCSSAAQLANHVAVRLDRTHCAEMSCIAGVGGGVPSLVKVATEAAARQRPILAIDGCHLRCVAHALARHGVVPTQHIDLSDWGVRKRQHEDFDSGQADAVLRQCQALVRRLTDAHGALLPPCAGSLSG